MRRAVPIVALAVLAGNANDATAQFRGGPPQEALGRSLEVGARVGIDYQGDAPIVGGQARLSVDPWHRVDLVPSLEFTFQEGLTERQINFDGALYLDSSRTLYLGGGAAYRDTYYLDADENPLPERETRTGYNIFAGVHLSSSTLPLALQVEGRWTFVDNFEPRTVVIGLNYPIPLGF